LRRLGATAQRGLELKEKIGAQRSMMMGTIRSLSRHDKAAYGTTRHARRDTQPLRTTTLTGRTTRHPRT